MVNQSTATVETIETADKPAAFPDYPPRDDMQSQIYIHEPAMVSALRAHFGNSETTLVGGEYPLAPSLSDLADKRIPDLMVSFNCDLARVKAENGYSIETQGKPPEFALEVASKSTGRVDYTLKREVYARYGVDEYWRFDPSGGRYHDAALAGDRLVGRAYQPIRVEWLDDERARGYSEALGLYLCWEYEELRLYDPVTGFYLSSYEDEVAARRAETARADAEAAARRRADARADAEETARRRMEEELRRFRERFGDLDDDAE